ncbi:MULTISPECIES: hypothetical protein [unclassified Arthrobacter]|uniref:hypothetical protein n=1 Tax=unclassified Arthrobacter TaxID=235627 RepID=UPI003395DA65
MRPSGTTGAANPRDEESWSFTVSHPQARQDLSAVVLDSAAGEVAAYQLASHAVNRSMAWDKAL